MTEPHPHPAPIAPEIIVPVKPPASEPVIEATFDRPAETVLHKLPDADHTHAPITAPVHGPTAPEEPRRTGTPVWLTGLVALLLAGGITWVWQDRPQLPPVPPSDAPRLAALEDALKTAQQRVAVLEQRPVPPAPGTPSPDAARIATLEKTVTELAARKPPDTAPLDARIASLENRPAPAMPDVAGAVAGASAALTAKIDSLDAKVRQEVAQASDQAVAKATTQALAQAKEANQALVQANAEAAKQADTRAQAAQRLRAAGAALAAGQPLGDLPAAPATLSRYAQAAPPTESALRLSFPSYAAAAEAASRPAPDGHGFAERMWMKAQTLVTVRQGSKILVGAPATVAIEAARARLETGDLAGAVVELASLDAPAAAAIAPWKRDAQALLDARAALAALVAKS